ncbi:MAG TPA: aspartyl/asparaginyl beta-hydroxylase domain-containing protein [Caulobacteraceae bacterium]|nr:aspartyl/asparaginyl beta-hydroxylase domain-containing protein [Caulobacteraceae bacterium]
MSSAQVQQLLAKALEERMAGRIEAAIATLDQVLIVDPRNFLALLSKGALLDKKGKEKGAAHWYRRALANAPPSEVLPANLAQPMARARQAVAAENERVAEHLSAAVADVRERFASEDLERFDESLAIFAGKSQVQSQRPLLLHYPRLPAIPFYDRALFPWLETLEAAAGDVAQEARAAQETRFDRYAPYIDYPPGAPVDQWAELNHNPKWSTLFLWRDGVKQNEACAFCPRTTALLERLPLAQQPGFAPTVVFSVLDAHTSIPPHTGSTNTRLLCHLPLILPGPARFRVGNVIRDWSLGQAWVFDDTIEHEAWNDADLRRTILIFDIWNPFLSEAERALVSAMLAASKAYGEADEAR